MTPSYEKANNIRKILLLFVDQEIRTKPSNLSYLIKIQNDFNSLFQIQLEQTFFNTNRNVHYRKNEPSEKCEYFSTTSTHDYSIKKIKNCKQNNYRFQLSNKVTQINRNKKLNNKNITANKKNYTEIQKQKKSSNALLSTNEKLNEANSKKYLKNLCKKLTIKKLNQRRKSVGYFPKTFKNNKKNIRYKNKIEKTSKILYNENIKKDFAIKLFICDKN